MAQKIIPPMLIDANGDLLPQNFDEANQVWVVAADAALTETVDFRKTVLLKDANGKVIPQLWSVAENKWIPRTTTNAGGSGSDEVEAGPPGPAGQDGKDAYELAVEDGFTGNEQEWLDSLKGEPGENGKDFTYSDFTPEQLALLKGPKGEPLTFDDLTDEQKEVLKGANGASVVSIELVSDSAGGFSGGSATLSSGDIVPITITTV